MKKYFILLGLVAPTFVFGQLDRSKRPEPAAAPIINIKNSEVFSLDNGVTVIVSENHKIPRVSFNLVMGSDPRLEKSMTGLSEIAGSLIMSGTTNKSKDALDAEIDYIGATLRANQNSIRLSCLTKHLNKGLSLMSDVLRNANFPQEEVDRIIAQNESGLLAAKSDPGTMASNAVSVSNFSKEHPYGEVMTEAHLANITKAAIENYYRQTFTPDGSYLVVVGDITAAEARKKANEFFGDWKGGNVYKQNWESGTLANGNRVIFVKKPGAVQSVIQVTFPIDLNKSHEDYLAMTVLNGILGNTGFGSRLMQNLREDKAYTYGCYSSLNVTENGSWISAGGNFRNEVTDSAITQILFELERIIDDYVTDEEINLTKSSMTGDFARSLESPSTVARFALNIIRYKLPKDYYQTYLKRLDAVSKDDVLRVAQKYFTANKCNIVVVGNEEVLPNIERFDSDGTIEKLDAFGNEVKEMMTADISAEDLLAKYVSAVTGVEHPEATKRMKKIHQKLESIETFEEVIEFSMAQVPFPLKSTRIWKAPNMEAQKMEGQGMVFQKSYFDGEKGSLTDQKGKKDLNTEEIEARKKAVGLIPELNYVTSGMKYELTGIEKVDGKDCYVLKVEDGESEKYNYYEKGSFMKISVLSIQPDGNQISESYGNFEETSGILFPTAYTFSSGGMTFTGKIISRKVNEEVHFEEYQ